MKSLISVVIPCYNHIPTLFLSLASIKDQTYRPLEVIIVDDGSDKPLQTVESEIRQILEGIRVIIHRQKNQGAPAARNIGFKLSFGEYVIFWDADIVAESTMLERMYAALSESSASFVYSNFHLSEWWGKKKMRSRQLDLSQLKQNNYIHSTSLVKRTAVIPWDESLKRFQDWDYWLTLSKQKKQGLWIDAYLFTVKSGGTMSRWLPRMTYHAPWRWLPGVAPRVREYEHAQSVVKKKHALRG